MSNKLIAEFDNNYSVFTSPLPMQYLGSKTRIADWIITEIRKTLPSCNTFVDLFSGTCSVSFVANRYGYKLFTNDVQLYSAIIARSLFQAKRDGIKSIIDRLEKIRVTDLLSSGRETAQNLLENEENYFNSYNLNWENYKAFCYSTPIIDGLKKEVDSIKQTKKWNLFLKYYANTYFGVKQSLEIDTLREIAEGMEEAEKLHLMASVISTLTFVGSSTTHLAQYLKPNSLPNTKSLINKRKISIIEATIKKLYALQRFPLPERKCQVFQLDYLKALDLMDIDKNTLVYVDPPYFKEHYSRYYHILDTFALYDFPYLTFNPITGKVTEGRYREDRFSSDFGKKSTVEKAFEKLIKKVSDHKGMLAISYANTSLVSKDIIQEISLDNKYNVFLRETSLMHSGQGQPRNRKVIEYLFLMHPKG